MEKQGISFPWAPMYKISLKLKQAEMCMYLLFTFLNPNHPGAAHTNELHVCKSLISTTIFSLEQI